MRGCDDGSIRIKQDMMVVYYAVNSTQPRPSAKKYAFKMEYLNTGEDGRRIRRPEGSR